MTRHLSRLVLLFLGLAGPLGAESDPGLFLQQQTFPVFAGLGPFVHDTPGLTGKGRWALQASTMYFNTFRIDDRAQSPETDMVMDLEGLAFAGRLRWGLTDNLEFQAQAQGWDLFPGTMDGFLDYFHKTFGFANQRRDMVPYNQYRLYYARNGQTVVDDRNPQGGLTQWSAGIKLGENQGAALFSWFKGPVPSPQSWFLCNQPAFGTAMIAGNEVPFDLGGLPLKLLWGYSLGLQVQLPDQRAPNLPSTRLFQYTGGVHLGLEAFHGWCFLVEGANIQSPWVSDSDYVGGSSGDLHMGIKGPIAPNWYWEAAVVEEFLTWGTMEVGFHSGFTYLSP